ncbi:ChaN family lipoprotein [Comamonas humi]
MRKPSLLTALALATLMLAGCASTPPASTIAPKDWQPQLLRPQPDVLLLGEQHDAAEHQQWQRATVAQWAGSGRLAAVVMEMADAGRSTQSLPADAPESAVQAALAWNDQGWPWQHYGPVVMAAVRAGVPVHGGNLPRAQMRETMQQTSWDQHLPAAGWQRQIDAIRTGHCGQLPESQLVPMARIQLAKDASMARTAAGLAQPGRTVLVIAGRGHVLRSIGIPTWLPPALRSTVALGQAGPEAQAEAADRDWVVQTPALPPKDHCAALQGRWKS